MNDSLWENMQQNWSMNQRISILFIPQFIHMFLYHNLSICFYTTIYPYVFMENWRKWSFSYHQIPTLSYLLVRGSRFFYVLRQNTLSLLKVEQVLVTIFFEYKLIRCLTFDCPRNSINNTLAVFTMFMRPQIIKQILQRWMCIAQFHVLSHLVAYTKHLTMLINQRY